MEWCPDSESDYQVPTSTFSLEIEQLKIYHKMEDKYEQMTYLVMASVFVNTMFYMFIVISDPVRTINFK